MKKYFSFISLLICLLAFSNPILAQVDNRQRAISTIVADGLAQLPAQKPDVYNKVIGELAGTGTEGIQMIINMLTPADKGKNATFEYAINGIVNYVTLKENAGLKDAVRKGLTEGLAKCTDNANRAFLLSQLQKCATADDAATFTKYLSDSYLSDFASRALMSTPGIDNQIIDLMKSGVAPKNMLASIASFRKLNAPEIEPILLSWVKGADEKTLPAIYDALANCGGVKSLNVLKAAAQNATYPSNAMDAYLGLLNNLAKVGQTKKVLKEAKALLKNDNSYIQNAGLQLLMKNDKSNILSYLSSALASGNKDFRNAALDNAARFADKGIFDLVANKIPSLSVDAQADVIRWLGNNHVSSQMDVISNAVSSSDDNIAKAAIRAAGVIGGQKALNALIGQLGGKRANLASAALQSFNGKINDGVLNALNGNAETQVEALKLASTRRMYNAYDKVTSLLNASNMQVRNAAYDALAGVVKAENFDALCQLMESATGNQTEKVQAAAMNAIKNLPADQQYNMVSKVMEKTSKASLYYPLLGQAGNTDAIYKILLAYNSAYNKSAALQSLLKVDNPEMIDILYSLAQKESGQTKDDILNRFFSLIQSSNKNNGEKYSLFSRALALNPSTTVQNKLINGLASTRSLPALMLASKYLDNNGTAVQAATTVKDILSKNNELLGGSTAKNMLAKAQSIFRAQQNADAGYAVDEITGMLNKIPENGYEPVAVNAVAPGKPFKTAKQYENFEMYIDWKTSDDATMNLRSMSELCLSGTKGVQFLHDKSAENEVNSDEWNTLYIKVLNDRVFVESNGVKIVENAIIKNTPESKPINVKGFIEIATGKKGHVELRNLYIRELPTTPVFTLSDEEKKAGFEILFDGRSLEKWQGNLTDYVPEDGNIHVSANYGGTGNLYTKKKYSDFVYRFEFCFGVEGVNNGIGIRTNIGSDAAYDGMEIQVLDHDAPIYKNLRPYQQHGSVYGIIVPKHVDFGPINTWHKEEIRAVGDHITVTVDGVVILDGNIREACQGHNVAPDGSNNNPYTVDHLNHPGLFNKDGYISFCGHGAGVKFRNVRILDLSKKK